MVSVYVFWIHHEEREGQFTFDGRRDVRAFFEMVHEGLKARPALGQIILPQRRTPGLVAAAEQQGHRGRPCSTSATCRVTTACRPALRPVSC